jgi:hypothetical protein
MSVSIYQSTWRDIQKGLNLHKHPCKNPTPSNTNNCDDDDDNNNNNNNNNNEPTMIPTAQAENYQEE